MKFGLMLQRGGGGEDLVKLLQTQNLNVSLFNLLRPPLLFLYIFNILSLTVCVSESVNLNVNMYLAYLTIA